MKILSYLTIATSAAWWLSELAIGVVTHSRPWSLEKDRFSYWLVWASFLVSLMSALGVSKLGGIGRIATALPIVGYLGCLAILAGVAIRWIAVATLGRQFTLQVKIIENHELVEYGIYRSIRHPAYLGSLVSFLGYGCALENWISIAVVFTLPLGALLYRIRVEEKVLLEKFGTQYEAYCKRTKRLLPGLF
jgi:protein-S-isoprenylcysteine O-methyltransferase Ste14